MCSAVSAPGKALMRRGGVERGVIGGAVPGEARKKKYPHSIKTVLLTWEEW